MDAAARVSNRLERIALLEHGPAGRPVLLDELRQLVGEAEEWARTEADPSGVASVEKLREGVEGMR